MIAADKRRILQIIFAVLAFLYGVVFLYAFKGLAYAEPSGFPMFYSTGKLARFDLPDLYSRTLQNSFHPGNATVGYFFHLSYEVILLVPLSYLPQVTAYAVWSIFGLLCLLSAAIVMRRHFPDFDLLVPFAFIPTLSLLANAQDSAILVLIAAFAFDQFVRGRDFSAGAVLALGLFKYPFIVPLVAILCFRYRRTILGFIVAAVPILGISALMVGRKGIDQYLALMHTSDVQENPGILSNLRGIVGVTTGSFHPAFVVALSVALMALTVFLIKDRIPLFCVGVIVTQLVSYHGHIYDAVLLLIPIAWMYRSKVAYLSWSALVLIFGPILIFRQEYSYVLAIALCVFLALLFTPRFSPALTVEN